AGPNDHEPAGTPLRNLQVERKYRLIHHGDHGHGDGGDRLGLQTVGAAGLMIMIACGVSIVRTSSTMSWSVAVIGAAAKVRLGTGDPLIRRVDLLRSGRCSNTYRTAK
ncbi:MAG TPA: hypothetical protein VE476_08635, partial [Propionibacteriaceae bacterium]|nr:hypothetical protein [Propionibacteriaceae bacterium]